MPFKSAAKRTKYDKNRIAQFSEEEKEARRKQMRIYSQERRRKETIEQKKELVDKKRIDRKNKKRIYIEGRLIV